MKEGAQVTVRTISLANKFAGISHDFACRAISPTSFRTISLAGDHAFCRFCNKGIQTSGDRQKSARVTFLK